VDDLIAPITTRIEISRPAEVVFAYVTDPGRFAEWQHDVVTTTWSGARRAPSAPASRSPGASARPPFDDALVVRGQATRLAPASYQRLKERLEDGS
jgi:uncharacterized protein YndB with AHSA1/START domain